MEVEAYLQRIRHTGRRDPSPETLRAVHRAHMMSVPFENLDIHLKRPIILDTELFFEKIVRKNRGGFCYELNGLFASLLRALGFPVTLLSARVADGDNEGPEFDHMALLVGANDRWLADVGFGDSFSEPLLLDEAGIQNRDGASYRITCEEGIWKLWQMRPGNPWKAQYRFDLLPRQLQDFAAMCLWHQTSPESHFTQKRICSRATPHGRVTLSDMTLIVTEDGVRHDTALADDDAQSTALKLHFGIEIA